MGHLADALASDPCDSDAMKPILARLAFPLTMSLIFLFGGCASKACLEAFGTTARSTRDATDGVCLSSDQWKPTEKPAGVVVLVHGLLDHAQRFEGLAQALRNQGFMVYAQDHRGHGLSGGARQRFDSIEQLVVDLDGLIEQARSQVPGAPLFLVGHSMGGLVATHYTLKHPSEVRALVLSGPALAISASVKPLEKRLARIVSSIAPSLGAQALDMEQFLHDGDEKVKFYADPLISHEKLPARSAASILDGVEALEGKFSQITVSLLVLHGAEDKVTEIEGSKALVAQSGSLDKTLEILPGQRHDLFHEPLGAQLAVTVSAWMKARVAPPVAQP